MRRFLRVKRAQGKPLKWIAKKLGVTIPRAMAHVIAMGLAHRSRQVSPHDLAPLGEIRTLPGEGLCRWIVGDIAAPWQACARPAQKGSPWCPHHRARTYAPRRTAVKR